MHRAYSTQGQEAFLEGHQQAFEVLGGTPSDKIRYDNLKSAVSRVLFGRNRTESAPGSRSADEWEVLCRNEGSTMVMTSTLSAEPAQHFYRQLGYVDTGCQFLPGESIEIIFRKQLA